MSQGEYSSQEGRPRTESSESSASQENSQGSQSQDSDSSSFSQKSPKDYDKLDSEEGKYLYIIWEKDSRFYKIGITNCLTVRQQNLQTGNSHDLILKRVFKGKDAKKVEMQVHKEIVREKIGVTTEGGKEWFKVDNKEDLYTLVSSKTKIEGIDFQEVSVHDI